MALEKIGMKRIRNWIIFIILNLSFQYMWGQDTLYAHKGLKALPGHFDIVIIHNKNSITYQLFNHYYTMSYVRFRNITVPIDSLIEFNKQDSINIVIDKGQIYLKDKLFNISKKINKKKTCRSFKYINK
jgi:hypothetical protein